MTFFEIETAASYASCTCDTKCDSLNCSCNTNCDN